MLAKYANKHFENIIKTKSRLSLKIRKNSGDI